MEFVLFVIETSANCWMDEAFVFYKCITKKCSGIAGGHPKRNLQI